MLLFLCTLLSACSNEPSDRDIDLVSIDYLKNKADNIKSKNFTGISISDISGLKDMRFESAEKIQCIPEASKSKIFICEILLKYEVLSEDNSISNFLGFFGKKSEVIKLRLFQSKEGWSLLN